MRGAGLAEANRRPQALRQGLRDDRARFATAKRGKPATMARRRAQINFAKVGAGDTAVFASFSALANGRLLTVELPQQTVNCLLILSCSLAVPATKPTVENLESMSEVGRSETDRRLESPDVWYPSLLLALTLLQFTVVLSYIPVVLFYFAVVLVYGFT